LLWVRQMIEPSLDKIKQRRAAKKHTIHMKEISCTFCAFLWAGF